jgi:signal transduction histidine kinase
MSGRFAFSLRVSRTLVVALVMFTLIPVATAAVFAMTLLDGVVRKQTEASLRVAANLTQANVIQFLEYLKGRTLDVADDWYIKESLSGGRFGRELDRYLAVNRSHMLESDEIFVLDNAGRVVASSDAGAVGRDDSGASYFAGGRRDVYVGDLVKGGDGRVRWIVAAPIVARHTGAPLGVLANSINKRALSDLTTGRRLRDFGIPDESMRRGRTGEVYVVDRDGLMITESRFIDEPVLSTKVDTLPVRLARSGGQPVLAEYPDYRGVRVAGASALIPGLGWTVLAEVDQREAIWPVRYLQTGLALLGLLLLPAMAVVGFVIHRSTVRPIRAVLAADERVTVAGPQGGILAAEDFGFVEWRRLVAGRNTMLSQLNAQAERLREQLETERLYRDVQEADRRKDIFLATLAHELRNPLSAITGATHALNVLPADDDKRPRLRRIINDQALQIARIVDELFDVSRIAAGKLALRLQRVNLADALRQVIDGIEAAGRAIPGQLVLSETNEPLVVVADSPRLAQIFRNVLDNAIKYSPPGAAVHVSLERRDTEAVVRITDSGAGISAEDLPYIFEPFRQSPGAMRQGGGLGLGLALVRGLLEQHHGRITVTSDGVGKGSEFQVHLPLADQRSGHE